MAVFQAQYSFSSHTIIPNTGTLLRRGILGSGAQQRGGRQQPSQQLPTASPNALSENTNKAKGCSASQPLRPYGAET